MFLHPGTLTLGINTARGLRRMAFGNPAAATPAGEPLPPSAAGAVYATDPE
jgi:hypothetical protein